MKWKPRAQVEDIEIYRGRNLTLAYKYYNRNPNKRTILLLYGFDGNIEMMNIFAPVLSEKQPVLVLDYPGHCYSPVDYNYTIDSLTEEIGVFLESIGEKSIDLIGFSFGGIIALKFYEKFMGKVNKFVLLHTTSRFAPNIFKKISYCIFEILLTFIFEPMINRICIPILMDKYFDRSLLKLSRTISMYNDYRSVRYNFLNIIYANYDNILRKIECPVLLIGSKTDFLVPESYTIRISGMIKNVKTLIFKDIGHLSIVSKTRYVSDIITDFLRNEF